MTFAIATPLSAQGLIEFQTYGVGRFATSTFTGGGLGLAWRSAGRERFSVAAAAGSRDGQLAGRGEFLVGYYLSPGLRSGISPYGAAGVATEFTSAGHQEDIVLALGIESRPAASFGWFLEAGVSGGVRTALGFRWRHRHS